MRWRVIGISILAISVGGLIASSFATSIVGSKASHLNALVPAKMLLLPAA
jgi:hypothetical protein